MIEIRNLDFSYKKTPVFSDINLSFPQGAIYGLLGENGVGKTTLLKIICGLQRPLKGTCTVDGMTSHDRLPEMLQRVVFLPDEVTLPDNSTPQRYVSELAPFYPTFSQGSFLHLMQELEVEPERKFREMSFGQLVDVALRSAVVGQRHLIGQEDDALQHLGQTVVAGHAVDGAGTTHGTLQAADNLEQGGLAHAVLTQQAIDGALRETQIDVTEDRRLLVTKVQISDFYHNVSFF